MMAWGLVAGIMVGLVIAFILLRAANTNHRMKSDYDERQERIRGKAYMYAFYTMMIYEAAMVVLKAGEIVFPFEDYLAGFIGVILGCIVLGCYCIWHDVYWGLNNNRRRYYIIFGVIFALNLMPVVMQAASGTLIQDGKIGLPMLNILVIFMLAVFGIELLIKHFTDRSRGEED
ncbi:MAG: hypothetical protein K6G83_04955 [Lachnospiraceae bacterium]|nr:hypothetical protein [Lachnospiraceae bacterium]